MALPIAAAALLVYNYQLQSWTYDDAYITMRYAENLAHGHGPVFNPGAPPVEGYTCFLWMCLLALGSLLGVDLPLWATGLGMGLSLGALLLLWSAHRVIPGLHRNAATLATLALGGGSLFATWATSGMEIPLTAFLLLLAFLLHERAKRAPAALLPLLGAALCCALAAMARPDAALLAVFLGLDRLLHDLPKKQPHFIAFGLTFAAIFGAYFAWRYQYYGWFLPNTFYNKVGGTTEQIIKGLQYATQFSAAAFFTLVPALALLFQPRLPGRPTTYALPLYLLAHAAYMILVGGDYMPSFRFYAPLLPLLCLAAGLAIASAHRRPWPAIAVALLIAAQNYYYWNHGEKSGINLQKDRVAERGRAVGVWLQKHAPPDALLATNTAGSIPFYSKLPTVDMLGLTDATIAHRDIHLGHRFTGHEKSDGKYVLSRKPDYIQFGSSRGSKKPGFKGDKDIAAQPEFKRDYTYHPVNIPDLGTLHLYLRNKEAGGKGLNIQ